MLIKRPQTEALTGLSRSAIYAKLTRNPKRPGDYDPTFPRPANIGARSVAWVKEEVEAWVQAQIAKRDEAVATATAKKTRQTSATA